MMRRVNKMWRGLTLAGMLCVGLVTAASAKFWGWETTSTTDWADGQCAYRETCRVHYVLWIPGEEKCETVTIGCLE